MRRLVPALAATLLVACGARTELDETPGASFGWESGERNPTAICPGDIDTTPLTEVVLAGYGTDDSAIVSYHWELLGKPAASSCLPPSPSNLPAAQFTPDVAGEYPVRLTVTDDEGNSDSCELVVRAKPNENFRVEMFWNPPESPSDPTDVDLHLLHPSSPAWFSSWGDCHYMNCSAAAGMVLDWDAVDYLPDNPTLDIDDLDGFGPENINISRPVAGHRYTVGVHYFSDDGWGPSQVYVKIYCGTSSLDPIYEVGPMQLYGASDPTSNEFWKVAHLTWDGQGCAVEPLDEIVAAWEASQSP
jgi:hypothetical protein